MSLDTEGLLPVIRRCIEGPTSTHPTASYSNPKYKTISYAPFLSAQFDITPQFHINLAGRYDTEKRSIREVAAPSINPLTGSSYNNCVALTGKIGRESCGDIFCHYV